MDRRYPVALFRWLEDANVEAEDFPDGAWEAYIKDKVIEFNEENDRDFDEHEAWIAWIRWRDDD